MKLKTCRQNPVDSFEFCLHEETQTNFFFLTTTRVLQKVPFEIPGSLTTGKYILLPDCQKEKYGAGYHSSLDLAIKQLSPFYIKNRLVYQFKVFH